MQVLGLPLPSTYSSQEEHWYSRLHSDSSFHPKLRAFQGVRLYTESAPTPTTFPYGEAHACSFPHFGYDAQGDKTISFTVLIQRECSFTETHPWVMKCGVNIPTHTYTDCNIVDRLCDKGFNANEILKFLQEKRFDEKMGNYLLLKEQACKEIEHESTSPAKPEDPCPTPPSPTAQTATSALPLKGRAREPTFGLP